MPYWLDEPRRNQEITVRHALRATLGISLLVHLAALLVVAERTRLLAPDDGTAPVSDRLQVRLAATAPPVPLAPLLQPKPTRPRSAPAPRPKIARAPTASVPQAKAPHRPPLIASRAEAPPIPTPPPVPAPPAPSPAAPSLPQASRPLEGDLWSYVQARRRERGEPEESPARSEAHAAIADLAANLPRPATGTATRDMNHGGGIFEIKRMTYDDAAFLFFGWNKDMGRETPQLITVRIGVNPNMRIAVVRSMIATIRQYTQEDFFWRSARRADNMVLSARPSDNAALESFLLREFFDDNGEPY